MKREPFGYWWWMLRVWYPGRFLYLLKERLPFAVAQRLPRKLAYMAFIRVYASMGDVGPDFDRVNHAWDEQGR